MLRRLLERGARSRASLLMPEVRALRTSCTPLAAASVQRPKHSPLGKPSSRKSSAASASALPSAPQGAPSKSLFKYPLKDAAPLTIYEHPELYEIAFGFRNMQQEISFVQDVFAKHVPGVPLNSVLELGCGPAAHSIGLAVAGVPQVVGLDLSEEMLEYARWKVDSQPSAASMELVHGDMSSFDLQGRQFDMVMCLLGTFSHMLDNTQALSCFRSITRHLKPGGILVLELGHPGDLFDGTYIIGDVGKEMWEMPLGATHKVLVEWGSEFDNFDPVTQVLHRTVTLNIMKGDDLENSLGEEIKQRQFTVQEILLLASASGLKLESLYGEMSLDVDLNHEEAYRMIAVLKK